MANSTVLMYGESGVYKTTQIGYFARYQVEKMQKLTGRDDCYVRLLTADSTWGPCEREVAEGLIVPWNLKTIPIEQRLAGLSAAVRGYWPTSIDKNGVADMDSFCEPHFDGEQGLVAAYAYEGLTQVADLLIEMLTALQIDTGEPLAGKFAQSIQGVNFRYANASRGTYGSVQLRSRELVRHLSALPVDRVLCTAHEGKGEDEITKRTVFGPAIAGKAANDKVAQWFGCTLHHESYTQKTGPDAAVSGVRAYFARHPDSELGNVFWPAKLDAPPRVKAAIMRRWPGNYVPLTIDEKGESMSDVSDLLRMLDANSMVEVEARVPVVNTTRKGKR